MVTADSSVWINHFRGTETGGTRSLRRVLEDNVVDLVLLDLVLMEVLRGFRNDRDWRLARQALDALPLAVAGGKAVALRAAAIYRTLRRRGVTVRSPIDLMVAAWCLEQGCPLLHDDRDFQAIEGLHTIALR